MAGHSKWANIKFRKAAQDAKRGKIFTKLIREITVAARMGGDDLESNPRLRDAINKALKANMKRDTIDNAIKRGAVGLEGANMNEVRYEGYGPSGVAILVDCLTDNIKRTVAEVRHAFSKHGGNLGTDGSVAYLFSKQGELLYPPGTDEERIMEIALECGAQDIQTDEDGSVTVITMPEEFETVCQALQQQSLIPDNASVTLRASNYISVDQNTAETLLKLIDVLEDLDDVQEVYSNASINDDILTALGG
ncbi:MAG: YebC/PmpR family DNA-binding transcriptional regulator [Legionellales bacterium]|nr:YebC/PmpR family DNA-binding transcriptional regulator [Legionellales bacterium]